MLKPVNQDKPAGFADDEQAGLINQPDMVCGAAVPYGQKKQGEYTLEIIMHCLKIKDMN